MTDCCDQLKHEIDVLKRQINSVRRVQQLQDEWLDTINSPVYKRIWWWIGGYKFFRVGRWYSEKTIRYRVWLKVANFIHCK